MKDYRQDVLAFIATIDTPDVNWEDKLLRGAPDVLTASEVIGIAEWLETDAPIEWYERDGERYTYTYIAARLREIVATER